MAIINATNTKLNFNVATDVTTNTATGVEGIAIKYNGSTDSKILLLLGGANGSATIKKGDMLQSTSDLTITVSDAKEKALVIESGKYLKSDGTVVISGLAGLTLKAILLP